MVRSKQVCDTGKLVEKLVLEPKYRCRSDNGGFWEYTSYNLFPSAFGPEELGFRILVRIVRRYVNESIDIVLGDGFCYALGAFDIHVLEIKVPVPIRTRVGVKLNWLTLWDSRGQPGCTQYQNVERFPQVMAYFADRIPRPVPSAFDAPFGVVNFHTRKTTRPRSPVTLRCLFAISSRKGTTTVHPLEASACQNVTKAGFPPEFANPIDGRCSDPRTL